MLAAMDEGADLSSLRVAISAGETLPAPVYEAWTKRTGVPILDGIGSTEMLHVFITNRLHERKTRHHRNSRARLRSKIVDQDFNEAPRGTVRQLAVTDRLPLSLRRPSARICAERLEPDRRCI